MIIKNLKLSLLLLSFTFFFFSCGGGEATDENTENDSTAVNTEEEVAEEAPAEEVNAVCIWSSTTIKKTPEPKGKYVTTIKLGEVVTTFGETVTDSSTSRAREYVKVKFSDGTEGWAQKNLMAIDAKAYVVKGKTKMYKRPDILTATKKEFDRMQFLVNTEEQEGWVKVKAKRKQDSWFSEGWVKTNHLSDNQVDVTVAILTQRAMSISDKDKKIEALNEIKDNADFAASIFLKDIEEVLYDLMTEEIEEPVEGGE